MCQLQAKGIWHTKCAMNANQAAKHMLLHKANVNLQGCSTLQEINPEQGSREDHFHIYSCISQDLSSEVNTHQHGLKSRACAAIYRLAEHGTEARVLPGHAADRALPGQGLNLTPGGKMLRVLFAKAMRLEGFLSATLSGLKQRGLLLPACLSCTNGTELHQSSVLKAHFS